MRLRKSASPASGAWKEKGRTSSLVAILDSPCFEGWLERASPAATLCSGKRLTAPTAAEAARMLRRLGGGESLDMVSLLGSGESAPRANDFHRPASDAKDDRSSVRGASSWRVTATQKGNVADHWLPATFEKIRF